MMNINDMDEICTNFMNMDIDNAYNYLVEKSKEYYYPIEKFISILDKYSALYEKFEGFSNRLILSKKVKFKYVKELKKAVNDIKRKNETDFDDIKLLKKYQDIYVQIYPGDASYINILNNLKIESNIKNDIPYIYYGFYKLELKIGVDVINSYFELISDRYGIKESKIKGLVVNYADKIGKKKECSEKLKRNEYFNSEIAMEINQFILAIKNKEYYNLKYSSLTGKKLDRYLKFSPNEKENIKRLKLELYFSSTNPNLEEFVEYNSVLRIKDDEFKHFMNKIDLFNFEKAFNIINRLLESGYSIEEFCHRNIDCTFSDIKNYLAFLNKYFRNYVREIKLNLTKKDNDLVDKELKNLIYDIFNSDIDIIDYYLQTKFSDHDFLEYIKKFNLNNDQLLKINYFLITNNIKKRALSVSDYDRFSEELESKFGITVNGVYISPEEIKEIFNNIRENCIPINQYTYRAEVKRFIKCKKK